MPESTNDVILVSMNKVLRMWIDNRSCASVAPIVDDDAMTLVDSRQASLPDE